MEFQISNFKKSIIESIINDNRDYIIEFYNGIAGDYLIAHLQMNDTGYVDFLTDEQIEYYENLSGTEKSYYFHLMLIFIRKEYYYKIN